jgi:outer membrane biogenesis lipoprotein LolB
MLAACIGRSGQENLMTRRFLLLTMPAVLLLCACASRGPIIDTQGVDMTRYQQDLAKCETYVGRGNTGA